MTTWGSRARGIIDGHVHLWSMDGESVLEAIREATGIEKMGLASIQDPQAGAGLPQSLLMKARHPDTTFVLAGLNHAAWLSKGKVGGPGLAEQVDLFVRIGCDGLKMIEGKPTSRQQMDIPVTDAYFAAYWARVEQSGLPVLWHVNDPEEFWDPGRIPGWAKERNWGYGPKDAQKEALYAEVEEVLARHPRLKIAFAHFYFLSADLGRAGRFLDAHPGVALDLAPGIEMLYNISRDPAAGREFFVKYADRIVFGTDLMDKQTPAEGRIRAGILFRWLETDDAFRVPPEDGVIRGMALPPDVLAKIYRENSIRRLGAKPAPLNVDAAVAECRRLAAVAEALSGKPAAETEAARVADRLAEGQGVG